MGKFEQKEIKKRRSVKNTWYDWLNNYIPEPITKSAGGLKDKIVSLSKTNTKKNDCAWERKEIKNRIDIWILFETEEEKQEREKKLEKNRN